MNEPDHYPYEGYSEYRRGEIPKNPPELQRKLVSLSIEHVGGQGRVPVGPIMTGVAIAILLLITIFKLAS